jgi:hypothetical protein
VSEFYTAGPLKLKLSGTHEIIHFLKEEFSDCTTDACIDIEIIINENKKTEYKPTHYSGKGSMNFNADTFHVDNGSFYFYEVENAFNDKLMTVNICLKKPTFAREVFRFLKSLLSVEYNSKSAYIKGEIASYSLLWSVIALCLLKKDNSFIHAGVLARKNKAIVLSGTGGCGKTSTVLRLLSYEGFQYLAEDFGIVGSQGVAYPCMKTVSLYHSDVLHGDPGAINGVKALNPFKRLRWEFLSKILRINPIIKVKPSSLTKLALPSAGVPVKYGVHLSRQDIRSFELRRISIEEYAQRSASASGRELKPISEILKLIVANSPKEYLVWSDEDLMNKLKNVYEHAFSKAVTYELAVPYRSGPKDICDFLLDKLNI